jgi:putative two-component system response regulator
VVNRPTILIVDDEPTNLAVMTHLLRQDYRVLAVKSAQQAFSVLEKGERPDIILLDVMMPDVDGYQTLTALRERYHAEDIPVIFVTALSEPLDEETGFQLGAVDFITKPISPTIVQARIKTHLEIKQSRDILKNQKRWLEHEVQKRTEENMLIQSLTMKVILELAEARDSVTGNHINRIEAYVRLIGTRLQQDKGCGGHLSDSALTHIIQASPLHDIGKIGIPDSILLKPARLTEAEFEIMKQHTYIGYQALTRAMEKTEQADTISSRYRNSSYYGFLKAGQQITLSHHENWDGSGYPQGLSGEDIPLSARIMAVADVYDALTTVRLYKRAWSTSEAEEYILSCRGKKFDPCVVDVFLQLRREFAEIYAASGTHEESVSILEPGGP